MKNQPKMFVPVGLALTALAFNLMFNSSVHADGFYVDASLNTACAGQTATVLPNGQLLIAGGYDYSDNPLSAAELYTLNEDTSDSDILPPNAGSWSNTGSLNIPRYYHTATLLTNGLVLVTGGSNPSWPGDTEPSLTNAELYDPTSGTWTDTGAMNYGRQLHTATLLLNGEVLVAGGDDGFGNAITNAELYNPVTGGWTNTAGMNNPREGHTATLLPDGEVLVTGGCTNAFGDSIPGDFGGSSIASAELYDPVTGTWTVTGSLNRARDLHTATLLPDSLVIVAGGMDTNGIALASTEIYDPRSARWLEAFADLNTARYGQAAAMLPDGRVMVAGGWDTNGEAIDSGELYYQVDYESDDIYGGFWLTVSNVEYNEPGYLEDPRGGVTASVVSGIYNCYVVIAGGFDWFGFPSYDVDLFDCMDYDNDCTEWFGVGGFYNVFSGDETQYMSYWTATDWMNTNREYQTATLLTNGEVLVAGGFGNTYTGEGYNGGNVLASAELYNPISGLWTNTGSMNESRFGQTATLLTNGEVLVAGGSGDNTSELYNPVAGTWLYTTGTMVDTLYFPTATLLTNGEVLVAGGEDSSGNVFADAELYNPVTETWTNTGSMNSTRILQTANILTNNGEVLVAGGLDNSYDVLGSAELYNPRTGIWTNTGSMNTPRYYHTATWLPNYFSKGMVLVAGGIDTNGNPLASAELYYPTNGVWKNTAPMNWARAGHTATFATYFTAPFVPGGVLVTGGGQFLPTTEYYSPDIFGRTNGTWTVTAPTDADTLYGTATLLRNGQVLLAGGSGFYGIFPFCELFSPGVPP